MSVSAHAVVSGPLFASVCLFVYVSMSDSVVAFVLFGFCVCLRLCPYLRILSLGPVLALCMCVRWCQCLCLRSILHVESVSVYEVAFAFGFVRCAYVCVFVCIRVFACICVRCVCVSVCMFAPVSASAFVFVCSVSVCVCVFVCVLFGFCGSVFVCGSPCLYLRLSLFMCPCLSSCLG